MRKSRFFKALMAWTLVVIMITANAGSVLTSRAVESTPVSQDGQDGQSQKDQLKEPASEEFKKPAGVGDITFIQNEIKSGLGQVTTGLRVAIDNGEEFKNSVDKVEFWIGSICASCIHTKDYVDEEYYDFDLLGSQLKAGDELSVRFYPFQGDFTAWTGNVDSDINIIHGIDRAYVSEDNGSYKLNINTSFEGKRKYSVDIIGTDDGKSLAGQPYELVTSDGTSEIELSSIVKNISEKNFYVKVSGIDAYGNALAEVTTKVVTNSTYLTVKYPDNVEILAVSGKNDQTAIDGRYTLLKNQKITLKIKANSPKPIISSITDNGNNLAFTSTASGKSDSTVYSQTSVDIAFDGNNHEVQIETSDAQGEGVLSFAKNIKSNEFYPTYKYTAFFTTRNVKPENAIDEYSVKFSSDSAAIESINAKTGVFTIAEDAQENSTFEIKATYKICDTEKTVSIKGTVKYGQFDNFNYVYVDKNNTTYPTMVDNSYVWMNRPVFLRLGFDTDKVVSYKVNDGAYTSIGDSSQKDIYADDSNSYFEKETKVNITTKAIGDNKNQDSSTDKNNFKYKKDEVPVYVDLNAPEAKVSYMKFYAKNSTEIQIDNASEKIPEAYKKVVTLDISDPESGLVDKVVYSDHELTDIDVNNTTTDSVNKILSKYSNQTISVNSGRAELTVTADKNPSNDARNTYYFYTFDKSGNCTMITCDIGALPQIKGGAVKYKNELKDGFTKAGNSVYFTVNGSFGIYETDVDKEYGSDTAYIKFYYVKAGNQNNKIAIDNISVSENIEQGAYDVTGTFDIPKGSDADGVYDVYMDVQDAAGNKLDNMLHAHFTVDNTAPVLTANKEFGDSSYTYLNASSNSAWGVKAVENNLKSISVESVDIANVGDSSKSAEDIKKIVTDTFTYPGQATQFVKNNDGTYSTGSCKIPAEAKYTVNLKAEDVVGNICRLSMRFYYDKTSANISGFSVKPMSDDTKYEDYKSFSNGAIQLSFSANDDVSGVGKVVIDFESADKKNSDTIDSEVWTCGSGEKLTKAFTKLIDKNFKGKINITVYDVAGNKAYQSKEDVTKYFGVVREDSNLHERTSSVDITENSSIATKYGNVYYYGKDENVSLSIKANDDFSGIKNVVLKDNGNVQTLCDNTDKTSIKTKFSGSYTIGSAEENEGEHRVMATLTDNAGNVITSGVYRRYVIDTIAPVISCTYDSNNDSNFYNRARTAHIRIDEVNFDPEKVTVSVSKNGVVTKLKNNFSKDGNTYVMDYVFSDDADYILTVTCRDKADNKANDYSSGKFTVDATAPVLEVSYDNNSAQNGTYYNASRTATIRVEEHNFDASRVNIAVTSEDGTSAAPGASGFTSNGDTHVATVNFSADGKFRIRVSATDSAGNTASNTVDDSFTIDMTAPEISISQVEKDGVYTDEVSPVISVTDTNYNKDGISISVTGTRGEAGSDDVAYSAETVSNGEKYSYSNFKQSENVDDNYTLVVTAKDMAGNETSQEIGFKVDRFGSYFVLGKAAKASVDRYYTNLSDGDIVIDEYNVAGFADSDVYYTVGDKVVNLESNEYTVKEDKPSNGWNKRSFTIPADTFKDEGVYSIVIHTKDAAGKETDNEVKNAAVKFCIDRTAPEYHVAGVENGAVYENTDSVSASVSFHDNLALGYADITVDGVKTRYEAKDIEKLGGEVKLDDIKASAKKHTIVVECFDAAGNGASDNGSEITFTVSSNAIQTAMAEAGSISWIIILIIVIVVLIIAGIVIFLVRKKKKDNN